MGKGGREGPELTRREREVLLALCRPSMDRGIFNEPASTREIAEGLFVTEAAVKQHLLRLYDKLEVSEGAENRRKRLATLAIERGVVTRVDLGEAPSSETVLESGAPAGLTDGRKAFARRAWEEAWQALTAADGESELRDPDDLARLGEAATWTGRPEAAIAARQRAYVAYFERKDDRHAALIALALVINFVCRQKMSVAAGWLGKARRHLEGLPEGREQGHLAAIEALALLGQGDLEAADDRAREALDVGRRHSDHELHALGLTFQGCVLQRRGRTSEAMALFDEAMASATGGELGPLATGIVYCRTICACLDILDYRRALEWTEAAERAGTTLDAGGFAGDCRAHRAAILVVRGQWAEAEQEARRACAESECFDLGHTGLASYALGEVRLRLGDWAAAEVAFRRAHELGVQPEPGLSLLRVAQGDLAAATAQIRAAVSEASGEPLRRAKLLPAQVEIALEVGDREAARSAATDLAAIAHDWGSRALVAAAEQATGTVALATGDAERAVSSLRRSVRLWTEIDAPFEAATARLCLGRALAERHDGQGARLETEAARSVFARLSAVRDLGRADQILKDLAELA